MPVNPLSRLAWLLAYAALIASMGLAAYRLFSCEVCP